MNRLGVVLLLSVVVHPQLQAAEPVNHLVNPSFELDKNNDERPDRWSGPVLADGNIGAVFLDQALPMNGAKQVSGAEAGDRGWSVGVLGGSAKGIRRNPRATLPGSQNG